MSRYDISTSEGDFQPGGEEGVLLNHLKLTKKQDIDDAETELLDALYTRVLTKSHAGLSFEDIKHWHQQWLGNLYNWAGTLRTVNMSKGEFHFAAAGQVPRLIGEFENKYLSRFSTLSDMSDEEVVKYLSQSHVDFILIHPFREGNGRISRLLMNVMAIEAGFEPIDYQLWEHNKAFYFKSIQAGVMENYQYIERLVRDVLEQQS